MRERAAAVVVRGGCVLMVEHQEAGRRYWTLPGGGLVPGETPEAAAVRELAEETGLRGAVVRELYRLPGEYCFLCRVASNQVAQVGSDPELDGRSPMLLAVAWKPLSGLADDVQGRLFIPALGAGETG